MASLVLRATPPNVPPAGDGRMKALGSTESFGILVLSANSEPATHSMRRQDDYFHFSCTGDRDDDATDNDDYLNDDDDYDDDDGNVDNDYNDDDGKDDYDDNDDNVDNDDYNDDDNDYNNDVDDK
jgi:hypothetical protein